MIRAAGMTFSRRCIQNAARRKGQKAREYSTAQKGSGSMAKVAAAGIAVVGVGGGIAYATGYISPSMLMPVDQKLNDENNSSNTSLSAAPARLTGSGVVPTPPIDDSAETSLLKSKKNKKLDVKEEELGDSAGESAVPDDFTAIPPPTDYVATFPAADAEATETSETTGPVVQPSETYEDTVAAPSEAVAQTQYLLAPDVVGRINQMDSESLSENQALTSILKEALEESAKAASDAMDRLSDAAEGVKDYTALLKRAMDDGKPEDKKNAWDKAVQLSSEKDQKLVAANEAYANAKNSIIIALQAVDGGRAGAKTRDNPEIIRVEEKVYRLRRELDDRLVSLEKSQSDARIMKAFSDLVEQGKQQFNAELQALMPDIKLNETGSKLSEAELNLLIAYAHRWIMQLQRQLAEYQFLEEQRLTEALLRQKSEDKALAEMELREALADQLSRLAIEKERAISAARRQAEEDLLSQLKRQAAAHSQHLNEVLAVQEEEYGERLKAVLVEGVAAERTKLEEMVSQAFEQLKGIESAIESRAHLENSARERQDLWVAVAALKNAVVDEHRVPLAERVIAVVAAAGGDSLVETLLGAIPDEALEEGVYSDAHLKSRFQKVREICKKVSMVTEKGGLFQTALSYVNYKVTNESVLVKPAEEVDPELDPMMKIVCHAQWYVEHDDLESALRCMNQLRGEPRRSAYDWIADARIALETRQAINTLYSWVSALNVGQFPPEMKN